MKAQCSFTRLFENMILIEIIIVILMHIAYLLVVRK
jgi:hypothetical protein